MNVCEIQGGCCASASANPLAATWGAAGVAAALQPCLAEHGRQGSLLESSGDTHLNRQPLVPHSCHRTPSVRVSKA